jgi:tetratricopeptide (TPR) repeat protein
LLAQVAWAYHAAAREVDRDDFLNQALKADADLPSAHFLLAERALERRQLAEARREFEAGLAAGGEEFFALLRYAGLLATEAGVRGGGPDAEATEALDEPARRARERILELLGRAKACFPRYVAENTPYLLRARLLRELGRDEEALAELRAFCDIHESELTSRTLLVQAALERGDFAEARRYLLELRGLDPFQRGIWRDLARCERELGRPADAITLLERALAIDPSTEPDYDPARAELPVDETEARVRAELLLDLAELRFDVGERDAALRALEEARALAPEAGRIEALDERAAGSGERA